MNRAIVRLSTWHNTSSDENCYVGDIYISDCGSAIICATSKDTGYYDEWSLHDFYREFTFVSEESL